ncbi:MAG: hypothetical protein AAF911_06260 [Planctomycetota bacterium]
MIESDNAYTQAGLELTLGRAVVHEAGEHDSLVHLWWRDNAPEPTLVQVYVNGQLVTTTTHPDQRELWLIVNRSRQNRIELLKVNAEDADHLVQARPDRLQTWNPPINDFVEARLLRDESLPVDTKIEVAVDGQAVATGELWPNDTPRSGFGGLFGLGGFGQDAASGLGLGRGELGFGPLGIDGTAWAWQTRDLPPGPHSVTLTATDQAGQATSPPLTLDEFQVEALPRPATTLNMQSDFTLAWTD